MVKLIELKTKNMSDNYVTKAELKTELLLLENKININIDKVRQEIKSDTEKMFEDFKKIMLECFDFVYKKLDAAIVRLDAHIGQNAIDHSKFENRIRNLEESRENREKKAQ